MKRILSIILCVAMLASMAGTISFADDDRYQGQYIDQIANENVMSFTTDKDSYAPGDTVTISVAMDSIWGDPALEDYVDGYEDYVMAGAYGMNIFCSTLIYDTSVFTAKAHTATYKNGTIANVDATEVSTNCNNVIEATAAGAYYCSVISDTFNADYDAYGYFNGSGALWNYNLTISKDAAPGTYYLPVGPYTLTTAEGSAIGKPPVIKFQGDDRLWAWVGNTDSYFNDREVTYLTNYTGDSRVAADSPMGAEYECSYVVITIEGEGGELPPVEPPVEVDPMSFELTTDKDGATLVPGDIITATLSVKNNEGLTDAANSTITFNNTALKLLEASTPLQTEGEAMTDFDNVNKLGSFEAHGTPVSCDVYFDSTYESAADGAVFVAKFEVLSTAEAGDATIAIANIETSMEATATLTVSGDHVHSFTEKTTPAECTVAGKIEQICSCGLTYKTTDIAKLGHTTSASSKTIYVPAGCETEGRTVTNCDVCGKAAKTVTENPLGHDLKTVTTTQTCTSDETTQDVCQREGCKYKTELIVINPALKHIDPATGKEAWGEPFVSKKPTTNAVGYMGKQCALCGMVWDYEDIAILPIKHGDCNMDGNINLADVSVLLKYIAKWDDIYFSLENSDVMIDNDKDIRVNTRDASHLLKYIAGWDVEIPKRATAVG